MSWMTQVEPTPGQLRMHDHQKSSIIFGNDACNNNVKARMNPQAASNITFDPIYNTDFKPRTRHFDNVQDSSTPASVADNNLRQYHQDQFDLAPAVSAPRPFAGQNKNRTTFNLGNDDANIAQLQSDARAANACRQMGRGNQQTSKEFGALQPMFK